MSRNMSFMLTTEQVKNKTKTVTRRMAWWKLPAGEILNACKKCMGLKKGEKVEKLGPIRTVDVRIEPLNKIDSEDLAKEGFPEWTRCQFIQFFLDSHKPKYSKYLNWGCFSPVNRIEFEYI